MNRLILAAAIAAISQFSNAACSYPLDATGTQYGQIQETTFSTVSGQSASSVITGDYINPQAMSSAGAAAMINSSTTGNEGGDITLPASGTVAVEFSLDSFPTMVPANAGASIITGMALYSSNGISNPVSGDGLMVGLLVVDQGGSGASVVPMIISRTGSNQAVAAVAPITSVTLPLAAGYRLGVYLNMTTRQVGYTINGTDYGYVTQDTHGQPFTIPAGVSALAMGIAGVSSVPVTDPNVGATIGGTLVTDGSQFTQPFPAGTTDICGASVVQASQIIASSTNAVANTAPVSTSSGAGSADAFSLLLLLLLPARLSRRLA